jgi:hypothetical protein
VINLDVAPPYAIPIISFFLSLFVPAFGIFNKFYESMIRDYEKPTVHELVVSEKQLLEA